MVGAVIDREGYPLGCELWPGNTADVKSLKVVARRLKKRFGIERMCVVADRGMISRETLAELKRENIRHILGVRMRRNGALAPELLAAGGYEEIVGERKTRQDPSLLKVKEVALNGQRYILCVNPEEVRADAQIREQIQASRRAHFKPGDTALVGNKGYRRYLSVIGQSHFAIDEKKVAAAERYDG
ncbi:MAG: transposase, partial [Elusimicrobia bacterium]|nr:transposase [Elusimicrobiota bacterium]